MVHKGNNVVSIVVSAPATFAGLEIIDKQWYHRHDKIQRYLPTRKKD
jgi:hypothetical protein